MKNQSRYTKKDYEVLQDRSVFKGFFEFREYQLRFKLFAGGWSPVITRELFYRGAVAAIMLHDPQRDKVVLVEQFRVGALEDDVSPWLYELVAGILEPNESLEDMIAREALEEANCTVKNIKKINHFYTSPGASSEVCHMFYGEVDSEHLGGVHGLDSEAEDIKVHVISTEKAYAMLEAGEINTTPAMVGLQWLQLQKYKV